MKSSPRGMRARGFEGVRLVLIDLAAVRESSWDRRVEALAASGIEEYNSSRYVAPAEGRTRTP